MASEIETRITLSGAEEVKAQLKSISETGVKALGQIKAAGSSVADGGKLAEKNCRRLGCICSRRRTRPTNFGKPCTLCIRFLTQPGSVSAISEH